MKKLLILFLILTNNILAQEVTKEVYYPEFIKNEETLTTKANELEFVETKSNYNKTWGYFYVRGGNSILTYNNKKQNAVNTGIGHKRISSDIMYGGEFSTVYKNNDNIKFYQMIFGYQPVWRNKLTPFVSILFGTSTVNLDNKKSSGFSHGLDFGLTLKRALPFHVISGMRFNYANTSNNDLNNIKTQEIYILMALEF